MRMLTDATLLTINGPKGAYYAILDHESGSVLTERTEQAAAALANEKNMVIVERREVSHAELLRMLASRYDDVPRRPEADQQHGPMIGTETEGGVVGQGHIG